MFMPLDLTFGCPKEEQSRAVLLDREEEEQGTMHTAAGGWQQAGGLLTDYIAGAFNAAVVL